MDKSSTWKQNKVIQRCVKDISISYIAGIFSQQRALSLVIGYFEFTGHLTMKMFPAKISERGKSMTSEGNSAMLSVNVDAGESYFQVCKRAWAI